MPMSSGFGKSFNSIPLIEMAPENLKVKTPFKRKSLIIKHFDGSEASKTRKFLKADSDFNKIKENPSSFDKFMNDYFKPAIQKDETKKPENYKKDSEPIKLPPIVCKSGYVHDSSSSIINLSKQKRRFTFPIAKTKIQNEIFGPENSVVFTKEGKIVEIDYVNEPKIHLISWLRRQSVAAIDQSDDPSNVTEHKNIANEKIKNILTKPKFIDLKLNEIYQIPISRQ